MSVYEPTHIPMYICTLYFLRVYTKCYKWGELKIQAFFVVLEARIPNFLCCQAHNPSRVSQVEISLPPHHFLMVLSILGFPWCTVSWLQSLPLFLCYSLMCFFRFSFLVLLGYQFLWNRDPPFSIMTILYYVSNTLCSN